MRVNGSFGGAKLKIHCPKPTRSARETRRKRKKKFYNRPAEVFVAVRRQQMDNTLRSNIVLVVVTCSRGPNKSRAIMCLCRLPTKCIKNYWTSFYTKHVFVLSILLIVETFWAAGKKMWGDGKCNLLAFSAMNIGSRKRKTKLGR